MDSNKSPSFGRIVKSYRESVREKIRNELYIVVKEKKTEGKYLYEGFWRNQAEIDTLNDLARRNDRNLLVELSMVFLLIAGVDILLALILFSL